MTPSAQEPSPPGVGALQEPAADTPPNAVSWVVIHRGGLRWPVLLLVLVAVVTLHADRAGAHAELAFTVPGEGEDVTEPFDEVTLTFLSAIRDGSIELIDPNGDVVPTDGPVDVGEEELGQRFDLIPELGVYMVRSEILAADGDTQQLEFEFTYSGPQERASRDAGSIGAATIGLIVAGVALVVGVFFLAGRGRSGGGAAASGEV